MSEKQKTADERKAKSVTFGNTLTKTFGSPKSCSEDIEISKITKDPVKQTTAPPREERKTTSVTSETIEVPENPSNAAERDNAEADFKNKIYNALFGLLILGFFAVCGLTVMFFLFPECSIPMRSCKTKNGNFEWFIGKFFKSK